MAAVFRSGSRNFLRTSLDAAKVGDRDKLDGFRRLEGFVRAVETRKEPVADFDSATAHELQISDSLDGRSVVKGKPSQRSLW